MAHLNAYLRFDGNCREAMTFYKEALGGQLTISTVGDSPMAAQMPRDRDKVMHSVLTRDGFSIMASDMIMGSEGVKRGNDFSLCYTGENAADLKGPFSKLAQGGKVTQPLKEEFFGTFGTLVDKFGVNWMFQADKK